MHLTQVIKGLPFAWASHVTLLLQNQVIAWEAVSDLLFCFPLGVLYMLRKLE